MKAFLCGYYGYGNAGDEALLATLLQLLPPSVEPIVLSGHPDQTAQQYAVAVCPRQSAIAVWEAIAQADVFIWGGGSLIQNATSFKSLIYYIALMFLAQQRGLRTIAWAQGIGPLKGAIAQWLAQRAFQGCDAVSVRDLRSAQWLQERGISALLAPDPVWALEGSALPTPVSTLRQPWVAINLRPHRSLTPERFECLLLALAEFQKTTQAQFLILPFHTDQDGAIAQRLHAQFPMVSEIIQGQDPRQLKALFRQVKMTIAMRLHALIMAAGEGCRCHALSYDPKVSALMEELQIPGWELEQLPTSPQLIVHAWMVVWSSPGGFSEAQCQDLRDRALLHQRLLETSLAGERAK